MNIKITFTYKGKEYHFERQVSELDRNYSDEDYALIFENVNGDKYKYFEINILKDAEIDGNLIEDGYVAVYESIDEVNPMVLINAKVEFDK